MSFLICSLFFDVETTGFLRADSDLIEIAALYVEKKALMKSKPLESFSKIVEPWRGLGVNKQSIALNRITQEIIDREAIEANKAIRSFLKFAGANLLVAHNAAFDKGFLQREIESHGLHRKFEYECTLKLARKAFPKFKSHKLVDLSRRLGIDNSGAHRALNDAKMTLEVFLKTKSVIALKDT